LGRTGMPDRISRMEELAIHVLEEAVLVARTSMTDSGRVGVGPLDVSAFIGREET